MPAIRDKDRGWRQTAIFTRTEAEMLIGDSRIALDHQVLWGFGLLAGLRLGEVSALCWADYDAVQQPLGRLNVGASYTRINGEVKGTKTESPRKVPVHPTLAALLSRWRLSGWAELFGRKPKESDLLLPNRVGRHLNDNNVTDTRKSNFSTLGESPDAPLRTRRFHDARRTFISLAQDDGALPHILKRITHGEPRSVMDLYTTIAWSTLCENVVCLKLEPRRGEVLKLAGRR